MAQVARQLEQIAAEARLYFGHDAVERATGKRVDWVFRITCPDNHRVQLHGTPSTRTWKKEIYDELRKHGWDEAKAAYERRQEAERKRRLEEDRKRNDAKLAEALKRARQETALLRAAGPYAPRVADPNWILGKHPMPETRRVLIPWELAEKILAVANTHNRPLRKSRREYWSRIMQNGRWRYTHQGIAFDVNGVLLDGQHRLAAAVETQFTLDVNVTVGLPPETFGTIDVGAMRSASDTLAVMGKPSPNALAGAVRLVGLYDRWGPELRLGTRSRIPNDVFAEMAEKYGERLERAVARAIDINKRRGSPPMSVNALGAGIYLISRNLREDDPRVEEFIRGYTEGLGLRSGDARVALREFLFNLQRSRVRRSQIPTVDLLGVFIKTWNDWVMGNKRQTIRFGYNELFPRPIVPPPLTN